MTTVAISPLARCEAYVERQAGPPSRGAVRPLTEHLRALEPAHAALQERHSQTLCELARVRVALADAVSEADHQARRADAAGHEADLAGITFGMLEELAAEANDKAERVSAERDEARADAEEWGRLYSDAQRRLDARGLWVEAAMAAVVVSTVLAQWVWPLRVTSS